MATEQPLPGADAKPPWTFLSVSTADYVKVVLSLFSGVLIASFVFWLNSGGPQLTYTVTQTVSFQGEKNRIGIFTVTVRNSGSKSAENVLCEIPLPGSPIHEVIPTPPLLKPTVTLSPNKETATVTVSDLNPGESFQLAVLAGNPESLPATPAVTVRGKGIGGESEAIKSARIGTYVTVVSFAVFFGGVVFLVYVFVRVLLSGRAMVTRFEEEMEKLDSKLKILKTDSNS